jgi:deoxyadenosine/deoxycytidine kinase
MSYSVTIVEGIIGVGKSTVSQELGKALEKISEKPSLVLMEPDEKDNANPYLVDFYKNPARWAFTMQIHLLSRRYQMHERAQWACLDEAGHVVLDRSYFGDTAFARLQIKNGDMEEREFETYTKLYHNMQAHVLKPTVCLRLLVSPETAIERINRRLFEREGRQCESGITIQYLQDLDDEITHMANVLRQQGVLILDVPWDVERDNADAREKAVQSLARRIHSYRPVDPFLDLHRKTV